MPSIPSGINLDEVLRSNSKLEDKFDLITKLVKESSTVKSEALISSMLQGLRGVFEKSMAFEMSKSLKKALEDSGFTEKRMEELSAKTEHLKRIDSLLQNISKDTKRSAEMQAHVERDPEYQRRKKDIDKETPKKIGLPSEVRGKAGLQGTAAALAENFPIFKGLLAAGKLLTGNFSKIQSSDEVRQEVVEKYITPQVAAVRGDREKKLSEALRTSQAGYLGEKAEARYSEGLAAQTTLEEGVLEARIRAESSDDEDSTLYDEEDSGLLNTERRHAGARNKRRSKSKTPPLYDDESPPPRSSSSTKSMSGDLREGFENLGSTLESLFKEYLGKNKNDTGLDPEASVYDSDFDEPEDPDQGASGAKLESSVISKPKRSKIVSFIRKILGVDKKSEDSKEKPLEGLSKELAISAEEAKGSALEETNSLLSGSISETSSSDASLWTPDEEEPSSLFEVENNKPPENAQPVKAEWRKALSIDTKTDSSEEGDDNKSEDSFSESGKVGFDPYKEDIESPQEEPLSVEALEALFGVVEAPGVETKLEELIDLVSQLKESLVSQLSKGRESSERISKGEISEPAASVGNSKTPDKVNGDFGG